MQFSETQLEILARAWALAHKTTGPAGQVVKDSAIPDADELAAHGWLERRELPNGDVGYWWTATAERAAELHALTQDAAHRQN